MIISIDGPSGSGKSTAAEVLSQRLGFVHFNSGSLYRAIAVYLRKDNYDFNTILPDSTFPPLKIDVKFINGEMNVFVNKYNCTKHLRENEISVLSPIVSINKNLREVIDNFQRDFGKKNNLVMDGRDIGSHVFPNADFKFYLDCSLEERAKRRLKEEKLKGNKISLKEIKEQLAKRDEIDKHKKYAPLVVPKNAIVLDSTNLSASQVVDLMLSYINKENI